MIEIVKTTEDHVKQILKNNYNNKLTLPDNFPTACASAKYSYAFLEDGTPIAIVGAHELWAGRYESFAIFVDNKPLHFLRIIRACKKFLELSPIRRVEAVVRQSFLNGHRFVRLLGFQCEVYEMKNYGPTGEPYSLYSYLREA